ncbi:MAG: archease [Methanobacteriota archaeon]
MSTLPPFEYFEVTADVGIYAYGGSLNELFENAALAMFSAMCNTAKVKCKKEKKIAVKGEDLESMLREWLTALLGLRDIHGMMFSKFKVAIDETRLTLKGSACGEATREEHEIVTEVKAITYHMMEIKKDKVWRARFILDV